MVQGQVGHGDRVIWAIGVCKNEENRFSKHPKPMNWGQQIWTIPSVFIHLLFILFWYKMKSEEVPLRRTASVFFSLLSNAVIVNCGNRQKESESWAINSPVSSQSRTATVRQKSVLNHWCRLRNVCSSAWAVYCHWYRFTNTLRTWTFEVTLREHQQCSEISS